MNGSRAGQMINFIIHSSLSPFNVVSLRRAASFNLFCPRYTVHYAADDEAFLASGILLHVTFIVDNLLTSRPGDGRQPR